MGCFDVFNQAGFEVEIPQCRDRESKRYRANRRCAGQCRGFQLDPVVYSISPQDKTLGCGDHVLAVSLDRSRKISGNGIISWSVEVLELGGNDHGDLNSVPHLVRLRLTCPVSRKQSRGRSVGASDPTHEESRLQVKGPGFSPSRSMRSETE